MAAFSIFFLGRPSLSPPPAATFTQSDRLDHLRSASEQAANEAAGKIRYLEESARTLKAFEEQHSRTAVESTQVCACVILRFFHSFEMEFCIR